MKPSLLPGVAAVVALFVFCFTRQVLRKVLDLRAANVLSAMLAGLVYYAAFVYEDEILAGMSIPDWLLPLALPAILVLLAIAAMSRRTPQAPVKGQRCAALPEADLWPPSWRQKQRT